MSPSPIHGTCDPKFSALRDALASILAGGLDRGCAVAVMHNGKIVADLWGGAADAAGTKPWQSDTLVNVWSVTKGVVAAAVAIAVQRGLLHYDDPIAKAWPEFAANGKERITLDLAMSHQAGLNGFNDAFDENDLLKWTPYVNRIAAMAPNWEPGKLCAYHALTYGHLAAEPLRRVSGKSIGQFVREEISRPLGADFMIGVPERDDHRCAEIIVESKCNDWIDGVLQSPYPQACKNPTPRADAPNDRRWRAAEIPGGNGHSTARALATIYGDLSLNAPKLMTKATRDEAIRQRFSGMDQSFNLPTAFAAGFCLYEDAFANKPPRYFGHNGWGGSCAFGDPDAGLGFAYVTNTMRGFDEPDPRRVRLYQAVYESI